MTNTRRDFLRSAALGATAATILPRLLATADSPPGLASAPAAASAKTTLLDRHRNLFNGDTCVYFYNPERWQP